MNNKVTNRIHFYNEEPKMPTLIRLSTIALILLLTAVGVWIAYYMLPFVAPFLISLILAVLIEPVNTFLLRFRVMNRLRAVLISNSLFLLLLLGMLTFGGFEIVLQLILLFKKLPEYLPSIQADALILVDQFRNLYIELPVDVVNAVNNSLNELFTWGQSLFKNTAAFLMGLLSSLPGFLILVLIMVISFIFMSYFLPQIKRQFLDLFTDNAQVKVNHVLSDLNGALIGFVRAQFILSSLTYVLALSGLMILGVKYALAIALIIVVVDILPILGTGSVLVPWAAYSFFHGDTKPAIGLLILFLVITVIRRIVEPKILGENIGLGPLAVIISLYLGVTMLGGIGLFLGPIIFILIKSIRKAGLLNFKINF